MSENFISSDCVKEHQDHFEDYSNGSSIDATNIVLLCGFPSSGTDLLKNLMNAHKDITVGGEFPLLPSLSKKYDAIIPAELVVKAAADLRQIDIYRNLKNSQAIHGKCEENTSFANLFARMLTPEKTKWVGNKTPQNSEHIHVLNKLFPRAKFIIIVRDVRDVALSWQKKWGKDPYLCAQKWNQRMLLCVKQLEVIESNRYLLIKYEHLLHDIDAASRKICEFLDLNFDEKMLEYHKYVVDSLDGKLNYGKPILKNNYEKWRDEMNHSHVLRLEQIAYDGMKYFEYEISKATRSIPLRRVESIIGKVRDIWALVFVGNRALRKSQSTYRLRAIYLELLKRLLMRI